MFTAHLFPWTGMSQDRIEDLHEIGAIDNAKFEVPGVAPSAEFLCY